MNEIISNIITAIFCIGIIYILIFSYKKTFSFSVPNVLTAIGVLGTFFGVCLSLFAFDVTDIQGSVPMLLGGLKTAFITSVVGMFCSIYYRVSPPNISEDSDNKPKVVTIETLANLQKELIEFQKENESKTISSLESIHKALTADGDSTLLTQIQKLRTSFSDKQDILIDEFKNFAEKMTKHNMDALTDAIKNLITDFNDKITEQFGENFKQLNQAVEKLVIWQQQYKDQVEQMVHQLQISSQSIKESEESLKNISNNSKSLINVSSQLEQTLGIMITDLKAFSDLADNAKQGFPIIESNINELTTGFRLQVENALNTVKKQSEFQQKSLEDQSENLTKTQGAILNQLTESTENANQQVQRLISENAEKISTQVEELDKALGEELEKSIQTLGSQLHSLSTKFVQDYTPLTDRLKEVVEISRKI